MHFFRRLYKGTIRQIGSLTSDSNFLRLLKHIESFASKVLSIAMVVVLLSAIFDLIRYLFLNLTTGPFFSLTTSDNQDFSTTLFQIFGLFLNVLIALEVLENITAYLKKHVVQLELVIITSLTAVARKIIIFDSKATTGGDQLIGLGVAVFALSVSYFIVRWANRSDRRKNFDEEDEHR